VPGKEKEVTLLDATMCEEGRADHRLTGIAERVNPTAKKAA
jgi:hypothetical protein